MALNLLHNASVVGSVAASTLSAWRGTSVVKAAVLPPLRLKLYDLEGCLYCRGVREALTALGLDAEIYPCPTGGRRFRAEAQRLGGKRQFPMLVDRNTDTVMYESADIIDYLFRTYGDQPTPRYYRATSFRPLWGGLSSAVRVMRGLNRRRSKQPAQLLKLWSFEASPYSRLVRERLTELELAYIVHNIGKEQFADLGPAVQRIKPGPYRPLPGGRREKVLAQLGRVQVPFLEDPNTGVSLFESRHIIAYLEKQYAIK